MFFIRKAVVVFLAIAFGVSSKAQEMSAFKAYGDGNGAAGERRYIGAFVFDGGDFESVAWDEGRIFADVPVAADSTAGVDSLARGYRDCWFAGDHLGNVRTVIDITPDLVVAEILEQDDYLPFGTKIRNSGQASFAANRWRYAGKEEQRFNWASASQTTSLDLSLLDFGARMYDPFTARWTAADPLAKKTVSISPYGFCCDDPINRIDPDGNVVHIAIGAAVGAVVEGGIAMYQGKSPSEVRGAMARGAIEGGIIAATIGVGTGAAIAINVAGSAAGSAAEQFISTGSVDTKTVLMDTALGGVTSIVGGAIGKTVGKTVEKAITTKIEEKYASKELYKTFRKELKKEFRNEGRSVNGKTFKKQLKERINVHKKVDETIQKGAKNTSIFFSQEAVGVSTGPLENILYETQGL